MQVGQLGARAEVTTIEDRVSPFRDGSRRGISKASLGCSSSMARYRGPMDLAADLTWLTGRPISEARLDEDLGGPSGVRGGAVSRPFTHQALGLPIGDGLTTEQAVVELDTRAVRTGIGRHRVAVEILASLPARRKDSRADET